jgi:hypothetical protein
MPASKNLHNSGREHLQKWLDTDFPEFWLLRARGWVANAASIPAWAHFSLSARRDFFVELSRSRPSRKPRDVSVLVVASQHRDQTDFSIMNTKSPRRRPGQPTAYRREYCETAKRLIARGATIVDLALHFDVDVKTIGRWIAGIPAFRKAVEGARCDPAHLRGLITRLEQARGAAVRDNQSAGRALALLDAIAANVVALRRLLAAREVKIDG